MRGARVIGMILITALLAACGQAPSTEQATAIKTTTDSASLPVVKDTAVAEINDGCTGAVPEGPVVDSLKYPNIKFHLANRVGYTDLVMAEGDSITIAQSNCDYASYQFMIHILRTHHDPADTTSWIHTATDIMTELQPSLHVAVGLDSGLYYLRNFYSEKGKPLNTEIHFDDKPDYGWINVVNVNSLLPEEKGCRVVVTIYAGPL